MSFDHLNGLLRTQRQRLQAGWDVEREMAAQKQHELQNQLNELNNFKNTINEVFEARKAEWEKTSKSNEKKLKDDLEAKWKTKVGNLTKHIEKLEAKKQEELNELTEKMKKMEAENKEMSKLVEKMKNEDAMKQEEIDKLAKIMKKLEVKNAQLVEKVKNDEAIKQETAKLIDQMTVEMEELKKLHSNEMAQIKHEKEESELRCNGLEKQLELLMKQNVGNQIECSRHQSKREHQIESENNEAKVSPKRQKIDSNATPLPVKNETNPDNFDADEITYIGTIKGPEIKTPKVPFVAQQQNSQMTPSPIIQRGIVGSAVTLSTREKLQNAESQKMAHQQSLATHPSPQQIGHSSAQSNNLPAQTFGNCMDSRLADLSHRLNQLVQQEMPTHPYKQP